MQVGAAKGVDLDLLAGVLPAIERAVIEPMLGDDNEQEGDEHG